MIKIESVVDYMSHNVSTDKNRAMVQVTVNMPKSSFPYFKKMISRKQNKKEVASANTVADTVEVLRKLRTLLHGVSI